MYNVLHADVMKQTRLPHLSDSSSRGSMEHLWIPLTNDPRIRTCDVFTGVEVSKLSNKLWVYRLFESAWRSCYAMVIIVKE